MSTPRHRPGALTRPVALDVVLARDYTEYRRRARSSALATNDACIERAWWDLGMRHLARLTMIECRRLRPYNTASYYDKEAHVNRAAIARAMTLDEHTRYERVVLGFCNYNTIGRPLLVWPVGTYDGVTPAIPLLVEIIGPLDGHYLAEETCGIVVPIALPGLSVTT